MQKDWKIGILSGLVLIAVAVMWLSTHPRLSVESRMLRSQNSKSLEETPAEQPRFTIILPTTPSTGIVAEIKAEQSNVPDLAVREQAEKIKPAKFHIVRKGETLSDISYKYYGSANRWRKILAANRQTIKDANRLTPGTKLIIPQ